jgi:hypothetical protein
MMADHVAHHTQEQMMMTDNVAHHTQEQMMMTDNVAHHTQEQVMMTDNVAHHTQEQVMMTDNVVHHVLPTQTSQFRKDPTLLHQDSNLHSQFILVNALNSTATLKETQ